uniref:Uncharacterized protein n=1 Tax=Rhizophora mucronata TaxID=61149 RepID=A0A2P2PTV3_RHIMU
MLTNKSTGRGFVLPKSLFSPTAKSWQIRDAFFLVPKSEVQ